MSIGRRLFALIGAVALLFVVASPAGAAIDRVGDPLNLVPTCFFGAETPSADADAPFHVGHGFGLDPGDNKKIGHWTFDLWVDGVKQYSKLDVSAIGQPEGSFLERRYISNFSNGLPAGVHSFVGIWTSPDGSDVCERDITFD
jgi:hypothetical protein